MKAVLLFIGFLCPLLLQAQYLSLYPYQTSRNTTKLSKTKFEQLSIHQTTYYKMKSENTLPKLYYVVSDTLKSKDQLAVVTCPKADKTCEMIATFKNDSVALFEIFENNPGKYVRLVRHHLDLTGDGINEVFIYISYQNTFNSDMVSGSQNLDFVDVWDPEKKRLLLNLTLGSNGHSWSMCNGSSSHSSSMEVYFYPGGFSVLNYSSYGFHQGQDDSQQDFGNDYCYTPLGFVIDTVNPCYLHVKNKTDEQELIKEYNRLKSSSNSCSAVPGLFSCLRLMGLSIPYQASGSEILRLLGTPDKKYLQLLPELTQKYQSAWREGSELWIYNVSQDIYLYFIVTNNKKSLFYWHTNEPR